MSSIFAPFMTLLRRLMLKQKYIMKTKLKKRIDNPNSTLWRNKADKLWRELIFLKYKGVCAICGSNEWVQAHHGIPREMYTHRHLILNGILLCASHHRFSLILSPHKSPIAFAKWLIIHDKEMWDWLLIQDPKRKNDVTFKDTIVRLEGELHAIKG